MAISIYEKKADYVAQLEKVLDVSKHFDSIDYARDYLRGDEFVRIKKRDPAGGVEILDRSQTDGIRHQ